MNMSRYQPASTELSTRELQVLEEFCKGKVNNEVADALCLSPKTTSTYTRRIMLKMTARHIHHAVVLHLTKKHQDQLSDLAMGFHA